MIDPEKDLHVAEIKIRLKTVDAALLRALAAKRDLPQAVLARLLIVRSLYDVSLTSEKENRRPA